LRFFGRAQGEALVQLRPDAGRTVLRYGAKAQVSGRLAAAGAPLIDIAAQELADNFFTRFLGHVHKFEREAQTTPAG
jgi:uncharacterized protein